MHLVNILNSKCFLFSGLDIGTLIDVRRAQLAYKLSDEVTLFFSSKYLVLLICFKFIWA
jgi:hypothetical protein